MLVEGWNVGWDGDWIANADLFSFTEAYPDYDLLGLASHARGRDVTLIAHNETSMGVKNYESQLDEAFALYERLGIRALKTGYRLMGSPIVFPDRVHGDSKMSGSIVREAMGMVVKLRLRNRDLKTGGQR